MNLTFNESFAGLIASIAFLAFCLSYVLARALARVSPYLGLVDKPNSRSSHAKPTPRGGGIAVLVSFIVCTLFFQLFSGVNLQPEVLWIEVLAVTTLIGTMGAVDDVMGLSPKLRLLLQTVFALLSIYAIHPMPTTGIPFFGELPIWIITPIGLLGLMWWLNLYNFMDGLDGLASSQTLYMCISGLLGICLLATTQGIEIGHHMKQFYGPLLLVLASCSLGFIVINWHPARIFLGDSGSLSQAYLLFMLAIASISQAALTYQFWLIVGAIFVLDATYTLAQRIKRKAKLSVAHRDHTYQRLFDNTELKQHHVTSIYILWNFLVLLPLSLLSLIFKDHSDHLLILAYWVTFIALTSMRRKVSSKTKKPTQI
ncbi:MAG: glycosyltransferase family 4 protein [Limnobacter sp.]|nr:glycosyltransferase family 4 protein [Limnobacter sp.]